MHTEIQQKQKECISRNQWAELHQIVNNYRNRKKNTSINEFIADMINRNRQIKGIENRMQEINQQIKGVEGKIQEVEQKVNE